MEELILATNVRLEHLYSEHGWTRDRFWPLVAYPTRGIQSSLMRMALDQVIVPGRRVWPSTTPARRAASV